MSLATYGERSSIPRGIWRSQNDIASPNETTSSSGAFERSCVAAARPYGPAPRMATSQVLEAERSARLSLVGAVVVVMEPRDPASHRSDATPTSQRSSVLNPGVRP